MFSKFYVEMKEAFTQCCEQEEDEGNGKTCCITVGPYKLHQTD